MGAMAALLDLVFCLGCFVQAASQFPPQEWNPEPPAVEAWSLNHRTTREFTHMYFFNEKNSLSYIIK